MGRQSCCSLLCMVVSVLLLIVEESTHTEFCHGHCTLDRLHCDVCCCVCRWSQSTQGVSSFWCFRCSEKQGSVSLSLHLLLPHYFFIDQGFFLYGFILHTWLNFIYLVCTGWILFTLYTLTGFYLPCINQLDFIYHSLSS